MRESIQTPSGKESLEKWQATVQKKQDLPPIRVNASSFFCSLGNGHFFQALNLFGSEHECKFPKVTNRAKYTTRYDGALHDAVNDGIVCVVLRPDIPLKDRKFISLMLNTTFEYKWVVDLKTAKVRLDLNQEFRQFETFDGLTKSADAFELDEIIEMKMMFEAKNRMVEEKSKL